MSRMVRDGQVSGLRERHWFAQVLFKQLQEKLANDAPRGELLALRGAILFHLYSALVGLARNAAKNYAVPAAENLLSLSAIVEAFACSQVCSPEINLLEAARSGQADPVCWLEQQVMIASAASGLARRPMPPQEGLLGMVAEDSDAVLASGDIDRLHQAVTRVNSLLEDAVAHMEEW